LVLTQDHEFKQLFETWSKLFFPMGADHPLQIPSNTNLVHCEQAVLALNAFFESFNMVKLVDVIQEQLKAMNQQKQSDTLVDITPEAALLVLTPNCTSISSGTALGLSFQPKLLWIILSFSCSVGCFAQVTTSLA
jgi:hypothetical protein